MSRLPPGLYGIADAGFGDPVELGLALADAGCRVVQLRAKGWDTARLDDAARRLAGPLRERATLLIVNDRPDVARRAQAGGVHLGQDDGPANSVRAAFGPSLVIGRSTHSLAQVRAACADPAIDYLGFGPVFSTRTRDGAGAALGVALLAEAVRISTAPVVAIGGITPARLPAVRSTGVHGWAVISAILGADDLESAARLMR